ncbi:hypothetical protein WDU94_010940 [Cyamophila willieti]
MGSSREEGYVKCYGCSNRYHYACSLSQSTWRSKGQDAKEAWRCEVCRRNSKKGDESVTDCEVESLCPGAGESSLVLKFIQSSLQSFCSQHDKKTSDMIKTVEKNVQSMNNNLSNLVEKLLTKIDVLAITITSLENNQKVLLEDNSHLKKSLNVATQKIRTLELKMDSLIVIGNSPTSSSSTSTPADAMNRIRSSYSAVLSRDNVSVSHVPASHVTRADTPLTPTIPTNVPTLPGQSQVNARSSGAAGAGAGAAVSADHGPTLDRGVVQGATVDLRNSEEWNVVDRRRMMRSGPSNRPPPMIGTKTAAQGGRSTLPTVKKETRVKTSALFVSRFAPLVTTEDIKGLLSTMNLPNLKISQIQTKHQDLYSSFHVEVLALDFSKIYDVGVWPEGCLIKPYVGRLLPQIVVNNSPTTDPAGSAGTSTVIGTGTNEVPPHAVPAPTIDDGASFTTPST